MPETRITVATPEVRGFNHTREFAEKFPEIHNNVEVSILIGLDGGKMLFNESKSPRGVMPFVQKTPIG